ARDVHLAAVLQAAVAVDEGVVTRELAVAVDAGAVAVRLLAREPAPAARSELLRDVDLAAVVGLLVAVGEASLARLDALLVRAGRSRGVGAGDAVPPAGRRLAGGVRARVEAILSDVGKRIEQEAASRGR